MANQSGREAFEVVKNMGASQEWSWGFRVLSASQGRFKGEQVQFLESLQVFEASPVVKGASIGTGTRSAKELAQQQFLRWVRSQLPGQPAPVLASREAEAREQAAQLRLRFERSRFDHSRLAAS